MFLIYYFLIFLTSFLCVTQWTDQEEVLLIAVHRDCGLAGRTDLGAAGVTVQIQERRGIEYAIYLTTNTHFFEYLRIKLNICENHEYI